jgi:hypothetical protein
MYEVRLSMYSIRISNTDNHTAKYKVSILKFFSIYSYIVHRTS